MKNIITSLFFIVAFSSAVVVHAQDSSGVKKQINASNEKADNLHGRKIQQQSLSSGKFEKLDSTTSFKPATKQKKKSKRKHR